MGSDFVHSSLSVPATTAVIFVPPHNSSPLVTVQIVHRQGHLPDLQFLLITKSQSNLWLLTTGISTSVNVDDVISKVKIVSSGTSAFRKSYKLLASGLV